MTPTARRLPLAIHFGSALVGRETQELGQGDAFDVGGGLPASLVVNLETEVADGCSASRHRSAALFLGNFLLSHFVSLRQMPAGL